MLISAGTEQISFGRRLSGELRKQGLCGAVRVLHICTEKLEKEGYYLAFNSNQEATVILSRDKMYLEGTVKEVAKRIAIRNKHKKVS